MTVNHSDPLTIIIFNGEKSLLREKAFIYCIFKIVQKRYQENLLLIVIIFNNKCVILFLYKKKNYRRYDHHLNENPTIQISWFKINRREIKKIV